MEQFNIVEDRGRITIELKPAKEIGVSSLQNPADDKATFRRKNNESHKGYLFNVTETCTLENTSQLITHICVYQNVTADDTILEDRLPEIKERTGVEEMVVDAGYTGEDTERVCQEQEVDIIPTEVKGRRV